MVMIYALKGKAIVMTTKYIKGEKMKESRAGKIKVNVDPVRHGLLTALGENGYKVWVEKENSDKRIGADEYIQDYYVCFRKIKTKK